jgi:hypothetical protein
METLLTVYAVYVADEAGPVDDDEGVCSTCVALFGDAEDAIAEARTRLLEGYSVSIDIGLMPAAEFDALDDVPDDFRFAPPASADAEDRKRSDKPLMTLRERKDAS